MHALRSVCLSPRTCSPVRSLCCRHCTQTARSVKPCGDNSVTPDTFVVCTSPESPPFLYFFPNFSSTPPFIFLCHISFSPSHSIQLLLFMVLLWTFISSPPPLSFPCICLSLCFHPHAPPSFAFSIHWKSLSITISDTRDYAHFFFAAFNVKYIKDCCIYKKKTFKQVKKSCKSEYYQVIIN